MPARRGGRISKTRKAVKRPARRTLEKRPKPKPSRTPRPNLGRRPVRKTRTTKRPTRRYK